MLFNSSRSDTWQSANTYCQAEANATLVELLAEEQLDLVRMVLEVVEDHEGGVASWWTSGTDLAREGAWYWGASLAPVQPWVWFGSEPDSGLLGNCMVLNGNFEYKALDSSCTSERKPICQRK